MNLIKNLLPVIMATIWIFSGWAVNNSVLAGDNALVIERFPAQVGNSWEYRRTFYTMFYDTSYADTSEEYIIDSLHTEFQAIDTLNGWECYKHYSLLFDGTDTFTATRWYAHPETAFLKIDYEGTTSGGPPGKSLGKPMLKFGEKYFNSPEELKRYLFELRNSSFCGAKSYSISLDLPKKLFVFPLLVGREWVAMTDPWLEERRVIKEDYLVVPGGSFLTLKIEISPEIEDVKWYQWISKNAIVKDSVHVKGVRIDYLGNKFGYWEAYDKYELLDYTTDVNETIVENSIPENFYLDQNYPNPFNPITRIQFRVGSWEFGEPIHAALKIYNIKGQLVKALVDEEKLPGNYSIIWNGKDDSGKEVASGIYFYQLKTKDYSSTKKMVLLR